MCFKLAPPLALNVQHLYSPSPLFSGRVISLSLCHLIYSYAHETKTTATKTQWFSTLAADWDHLYQNTNPWDSSPEILIKLDLEPLNYTIQFTSIELYIKHSITQNISLYNALIDLLYLSLSFGAHNLGIFFT